MLEILYRARFWSGGVRACVEGSKKGHWEQHRQENAAQRGKKREWELGLGNFEGGEGKGAPGATAHVGVTAGRGPCNPWHLLRANIGNLGFISGTS